MNCKIGLVLILSVLTVTFSGCVEEEPVMLPQPIAPVEAAPTPIPTLKPTSTPIPTPTPTITTPTVTVTTPAVATAPQSWRSVANFTGNDSFTSKPFQIDGLVWRVHWSYTADPSATSSTFNLLAWREHRQCLSCCVPLASVDFMHAANGSGVIDVFPGNSTYYVDVFADNIEWTLEVEEFV